MSCNDWVEVYIGDLLELNYGKSLPKNRRLEGNVPVYGSGGISGFHNEPLVNGPGIIIGRKGTVGSIYYEKKPFFPIDTTYYIVENQHYNLRFLYYFLQTLSLDKMNSHSAVPGLNRDQVYKLKVSIPPIHEQKRIADILSRIDDKIELNNEMNKTLEEMAQAIFKRWFVDFEFPNENGEPYKSSGGEMVESEIGLIPKSWKVEILGDLIDFKKGKKPKKISEKPFEFSLPYLTIDVLNRNSIQYASQENTVQVSKKDILMVMDGASSGTLYFGMKGILGSTLAKIEINDTFPYQDFLYFLLKHYEKEFKSNLTGSAVPHTDKDFVKGLKFAVPVNDNLLKKADGLFSLIRDKLAENNEENVILKNLRDLLLPKLMSGEIRVPVESD